MITKTKKQKKLIPELRFSEFFGEWEEKSLGEAANDISYGMNAAAIGYDGQHKYLRITDIDEKSREFRPRPITSPKGEVDAKFKLKTNDIVFARTGASVGKTYLYNEKDGDLYFAGFLIKFSIIDEDAYFIFSQTLKHSYRNWVQIMSARSGQPGINAIEYANLGLVLPGVQEQKKIASFLTVVDEKIGKMEEKKDSLVEYKKGMMQKIFSRDLPAGRQVRFKGKNGESFPDWEERKLGEIASITTGNSNREDSGTVGKYKFFDRSVDSRWSEKYTYDDEVLIVSGEGLEFAPRYFKGKFGLHQRAYAILKSGSEIDWHYLYYFVYQHRQWFRKMAVGSTMPSLRMDAFLKMIILLPEKKEQKKIAEFLTVIDEKIKVVEEEIENVKKWKAGLLQKMFV